MWNLSGLTKIKPAKKKALTALLPEPYRFVAKKFIDYSEKRKPTENLTKKDPYSAGRISTKSYEGWRDKPYSDKENLAIGYGTNISDPSTAGLIPQDVLQGKRKLTRAEGDKAFNVKYDAAIEETKNFLGINTFTKLKQDVRNTVVDIVYNLGLPRASSFKGFWSAIKKGNYKRAADELKYINPNAEKKIETPYYKDVGNRAKKHIKRLKESFLINPFAVKKAFAEEWDISGLKKTKTPTEKWNINGLKKAKWDTSGLKKKPFFKAGLREATTLEKPLVSFKELVKEKAEISPLRKAILPIDIPDIKMIQEGWRRASEAVKAPLYEYQRAVLERRPKVKPIAKAFGEALKGTRITPGRAIVKNMGVPLDDPAWVLANPGKTFAAEMLGAWYETYGTDPIILASWAKSVPYARKANLFQQIIKETGRKLSPAALETAKIPISPKLATKLTKTISGGFWNKQAQIAGGLKKISEAELKQALRAVRSVKFIPKEVIKRIPFREVAKPVKPAQITAPKGVKPLKSAPEIAKPVGEAKGVAPVKAISKDLPELERYYKSISAPQKLSIEEAEEMGIALRTTKGGKVVPAVRQAGPFVPEEFAKYKDFKDVRAGEFGGTKDITRIIQEIDGALPVAKRVKLPEQVGPAEKFVMWRTRDISKMKMDWTAKQEAKLKEMIAEISDEEAMIANKVLEKLNRKAAYVAPEKLVKSLPFSAITKDVKIIEFAQEARKHFEHLLKEQNTFRKLRNQSEIPHREHYSPHELQKVSLWEKTFGLKKEPFEIIKKPELPDYIKPNKPFNPRELAREGNLPEFAKELNLKKLLEHYTNTAARDIFNTSIVQNNKAFVQQLETMGLPNSARAIQDWTAEAFAGVRAAADRSAALIPTVRAGMNRWRAGLVKGVFPLNVAWNCFVQTSSSVLTLTRYGAINSVDGMIDWITNSAIRKNIKENAYSYIIKTGKAGKITRQDINKGMAKAVKLEKSKLDTMADAFNYLTEWTEKHLTGWSVATAYRAGLERGLKGKALREFASDGGAKTQSMYNLEDLPGMLRSELVKTAAPFQTFSFEVFNTMREFAGKTGVPPDDTAERIKWILRFLAGAAAVNFIGNAAIGRKPWQASSFIPFYGTLVAPMAAALKGKDIGSMSTRGLPSPIGIGIQFFQGANKFMTRRNTTKLRQWAIKYLPGLCGIPGGLQMNRIVDGIIAICNRGVYDSAGRMKFPIYDVKDKIRAIFSGPWSTKGGREYWQKRDKNWSDLLKDWMQAGKPSTKFEFKKQKKFELKPQRKFN